MLVGNQDYLMGGGNGQYRNNNSSY